MTNINTIRSLLETGLYHVEHLLFDVGCDVIISDEDLADCRRWIRETTKTLEETQ